MTMRVQMLACAAVALSLSACQPSNQVQIKPPEQQSAEQQLEAIRQQDPEYVTEAENRAKLEQIPARPESPSDKIWYVAAVGEGRCESLTSSINLENPAQVIDLFASQGMPLEVIYDDGSMVAVRKVGDPNDAGMVFVRGESTCRTALIGLTAMAR